MCHRWCTRSDQVGLSGEAVQAVHCHGRGRCVDDQQGPLRCECDPGWETSSGKVQKLGAESYCDFQVPIAEPPMDQ
ncbi:hypothetical protein T484DRAFT_1792650, partial [Baffinella frigidus]